MAYDERLAGRIRRVLGDHEGLTERTMFGGLSFLVNGHIACGVVDDHIVLRLGNEGAAAALQQEHTREMDFTGKPIKSMVYVEPKGYDRQEDLRAWILKAVGFAMSLPPR